MGMSAHAFVVKFCEMILLKSLMRGAFGRRGICAMNSIGELRCPERTSTDEHGMRKLRNLRGSLLETPLKLSVEQHLLG